MSGLIQLQAFVTAHPPHPDNQRPTAAQLARYAELLPAPLLELWREHGLGYYGERRLWLLAPEQWQAVVDQWVSHGEDEVPRIPILKTPFGTLLYYRKLSDEDEDISALNIFEQTIDQLSWDLLECFNEQFTDEDGFDDLVSSADYEHARQTAGVLAAGQVYEPDQLLSAILRRFTRKDAQTLFLEQFEIMQACAAFDFPSPGTLLQALPDGLRTDIQALAARIEGYPQGLYLSAYLCRYHLLILGSDGLCRLLCWTTHPKDMRTESPRLYLGRYRLDQSAEGDALVTLALDKDDDVDREIAADQMFYLSGGEQTMLIRTEDLEDVATALDWNESVEHPAYPLRKVDLAYWIPDDDRERPTPSRASLPVALRQLLRREPLQVVITQVDTPDDELEEVMVTARVEHNGGRPASMNMPMCSPAGSVKALYGWVWEEGQSSVRLGLSLTPDGETAEARWPQVGDVLVSRKPDS